MAKLTCLSMFGRKYKLKNSRPEHLPHNQSTKPMEVSLLVSPERATPKTGLVGVGTVGSVVWEGECPTVVEAPYDVRSCLSDEDVRVDQLKVDGLRSCVGEAEYEGGDEAERDVSADNLVSVYCEQLSDSGHLVLGDQGDGSQKGAQQDYYESPQSIPSCLTERTPSEIDLQSGHVSDPGTQWATHQSHCEPLPRSHSGGFSKVKPFEENDYSGCRLSDYSLNSGHIDASNVPSCVMVQDHGSVASGGKTSTIRNLSHQGFASTRSEGSAPTADDGVFLGLGASNGIMSAPTKKPWWKVTLRAHRSISLSSNMAAGPLLSSPPAESGRQPVKCYGSDGDVSGGKASPDSADLITPCHTVDGVANFGNDLESGNAGHAEIAYVPNHTQTIHTVGDASESTSYGLCPYLLSPPHLNGFPGSSVAFPAKNRVEEWVSKIDLTFEDESLPLTEHPSATGSMPGENPEDFRVRQHRDVEAAQVSASADVDMAIALAAARTLLPLATSAQFACHGLRAVPPLVMFNLKTINLSSNALVRISPGCFPKSVHNLDLSRNKIAVIEGLRELTRLRVLNISGNRITRIGHGLANCTSLRELYLGANKISEVEGLHRLLKLHVLDLSYNKLTSSKALNQLAANYLSLQALNLLGNGVVKDLGQEQLRKFVLGIAPHVSYLNKQALKSVHSREVVMDSVAKAAMGNGTGHHAQRGNKISSKTAKKGLGLQQQQLPPGHKRSVSGDPARTGLGPGQLSKSQGNLASLSKRQGHGHHNRHQNEKQASKGKLSADSSPLFQFESLPVQDAEPVMMRIQSDSALHKQDKV